ncbi:MAG: hypothetical protein ACI4QN_03450 [Candidatus Coproplasma sp.]
MKKFLKNSLLCATAALCACGVAACANKPENPTVTVDQLIAANDRQKVIKEYGNMHVTETTAYESGSSFTANTLFYANDYGLAMDYLDEKSDGSEYNSSTIMNGMMYVRIKNSTSDIFYATVFADDAYSGYVGSIYNLAANETVKAPEVKDGKIVVESTFEYTLLNYSEKKTYYFNTKTLLIERLTSETEMTTSYSSAKSTAEATYEYGCSDYTPAMTAYNAHINAENKSSFLVVRNAGTAGEKRTGYTIADKSNLYVRNGDEKEYALYADAACTKEVGNYKDYAKEGYAPVFYLAEKSGAPTVEQLVEANDRQKVIEEYGNLQVSLTAANETSATNAKITTFTSNEYGLIMDYEDAESEDKYNYCTCINGVRYVACKDGDEERYYASIFTGDYNAFISEIDNINAQASVGTPEIKDGKVVLTTTETYDYTDFYITDEKTYYCNRKTLLIEKVILRATFDGEEIATDEYSYVYGSEHTPQFKAYSLHKNATDKAKFVVVSNAGTASEKRTEHTVAGTSDLRVENLGDTQYALYSDAVHSEEVKEIAPYVTGGETPVFCLDEKTAPTLKELLAANDIQNVVSKYGNLHVKQKTSIDNSGVIYTANILFYANEYGLVMDFLNEKSDGSEYYSSTIINGMTYDYRKGTNDCEYKATLIDDGEYNACVGANSTYRLDQVVKAPEIRDGQIVLETEYDSAELDYSEKMTYYLNAETLLI